MPYLTTNPRKPPNMKTTPKHTPGPWNPIQYPADCGAGWWIQAPADINGCRDLATLSRHFSTEANARLIAAAPAMLEALRAVAALANGQGRANLMEVAGQAQQIIAQAEGGAQ